MNRLLHYEPRGTCLECTGLWDCECQACENCEPLPADYDPFRDACITAERFGVLEGITICFFVILAVQIVRAMN